MAGFIPDRSDQRMKVRQTKENEEEDLVPLPPMGAAEASGQIQPGHVLVRANGVDVRYMQLNAVR